jgi:hypothetical protein
VYSGGVVLGPTSEEQNVLVFYLGRDLDRWMDGWIYQSDAWKFRLRIYCLFKLSFIYGLIISKVTWARNFLEKTYGRRKESVYIGDK